tara:strand:+ start:342 stop:1475 length:1134 start_codon:yes stop_codon:yes gene_type:complete
MISPGDFFDILKNHGVEFFSGVPDSLLKDICAYITDNTSEENHIITANEGNAVAIGIGHYLATKKVPLIYFQNSGIGNIINPTLSLADPDVFSIPLLLIIGWRGEPGTMDEPQHIKQGKVTTKLLETMGVPYSILSENTSKIELNHIVNKMLKIAYEKSGPSAILVRKGAFDKYKLQNDKQLIRELNREQAIELVVNELGVKDIVVSTTGMASRELFEYRKKLSQGHEKDFLTVGGMGHSSQIALGVSIAKKNRNVYCIDGDGSLLMHMGSLAINGNVGGANFKHIIINNNAHDSVGGQPTVAGKIDIQSIAIASGYHWSKQVTTRQEIKDAIKEMNIAPGPALLEIQVKKGSRSDLGRPTNTPDQNKTLFMDFIKE